jgi:hypothetical protein
MAAANRSKPLTIDDLIDAQRTIAKNSTDQGQVAKALEQIERLMKVKGDSTHVTLGDVREEMHEMRTDLREGLKHLNMTPAGGEPRPDRPPLPRLVSDNTRSRDVIDVDAKEVADTSANTEAERTQKLQKIGSVIDQKTDLQLGGSKNNIVSGRNSEVFTKFITETKHRDDILKDASDKQLEIFQKLEDTMIKLKEAGSDDSQALRQQLAKLSGELKETDDTGAKGKMTNILGNAQQRAATGQRGDQGTLGDAVAALRGKKTVLKEGFSYDQSGAGSQIRDDKGKFASAKVAGKGRLAGAASILGNFIGEKTEKFVESQRSPGFQRFKEDVFGTSDETPEGKGKAPVAKISRDNQIDALQDQQDELTGNKPKKKGANLSVIEGGKSEKAIKGATDKMEVQTLNVTAKVVNITGGGKGEGASARPKKTKEAAPTPAATATPRPIEPPPAPAPTPTATVTPAPAPAPVEAPAPAPVQAQAAPAESGGSMLDTVMDAGGSLMGKGKGLLGKAGGFLKGAGGGLLKGGVAALGGMALSAGGDYLKENGHETLGGAVDTLGTAASWGGTGAMLGSVVPGVGTAIGGAIGGIAGAGYGLYKNFFGGNDKKEEGYTGGMDPDGTLRMGLVGNTEARATGGPVVEGKSYLVGEKGPEVMTAASDGKITPNGQVPAAKYGTGLDAVKGEPEESYTDQDGNVIKRYAEGVKVIERKDGTKEVSSGSGTSTYNASGKEIKQSAPQISGAGEERNLETGETTKSYNEGGLSVKQTRNASGEMTNREASYDLGIAKLETTENADDLKAGKVSYKMKNESGDVLTEGQVTREELQAALLQIGAGQQPAPPRPTSQPAPVTNNTTVVPRADVRARESAVEKYTGKTSSFY